MNKPRRYAVFYCLLIVLLLLIPACTPETTAGEDTEDTDKDT